MKPFLPRLCRIFLLLSLALLSACASLPPPAVYDFGLPAARLAGDGKWAKIRLEVISTPWSDTLGISYRLSYDDPLKARKYTGSRWAGFPGVLLAQRLQQQLGSTSASANTRSYCSVRIELQEFSQHFESPQTSWGVLQAQVFLINARRERLAEYAVSIKKPAATADAPGGVNALLDAGSELGQQLADWLTRQEEKLPACPL